MGFGPSLDDFSPNFLDFRPNFWLGVGAGGNGGFLHKFKRFFPIFFPSFPSGLSSGADGKVGGSSEDPPIFGERLKNKIN